MSDTDFPALARRREATIDVLTKCYADDVVSVSEFERRVESANDARTYRDLDQLLEDLPAEYRGGVGFPAHSEAELRPPSGPTRPPQYPASMAGSEPRVFAILSDRHISGDWLDRSYGSALAFMGSLKIDLTETPLTEAHTVINVVAVMADVTIVAPPDVRVELAITPLLADVKQKGPNISRSAADKTVRVTGLAFMADVKVRR